MCLHHRLRSVNTGMQSQRDSSLIESPCCQSWWPEFEPWNLHGGKRRELNSSNCPLSSVVHCETFSCPPTKYMFFFKKKKEWYVYSANKWSYIISSCVNVNLRSWKLSLEFVNTCDSHERIKDWHRQKKMSVEKDPRDHPFQVFACVSHNKTSAQCMW